MENTYNARTADEKEKPFKRKNNNNNNNKTFVVKTTSLLTKGQERTDRAIGSKENRYHVSFV